MNFDPLNRADCVIPQSLIDGGSGGQQPDARCSDAAFAAANPGICGSRPYLVIKPSSALIMRLSSIGFTVFEYSNGVESQVVDGLSFSSSNPDIFLIGASSGSGTGMLKGTSIITVTRNGLSASASVTVLDSTIGCLGTAVKSLLLIDNSRSMSLAFGGVYQSRLDFAKAAAKRWTDKLIMVSGVAKDGFKLASFSNAIANVTTDYIGDQTALDSAIDGIEQTLDKTDVFDSLTAAIMDITLETADEKVIVLISDGEQNSSANYQPIYDAAAAFKAAGGIIVVIGVRASGSAFDMLERVATGGFFLNGTPSTSNAVLDGLAFLKSSVCVGSCVDAGDVYVNQGELNYSSFQNWEVLSGTVDLCGNGFADFLPNNGLYLDMVGTASFTNDNSGNTIPLGAMIRSIDSFALVGGSDYTISFKCAGNNRVKPIGGIQSIKVYLRDPSAPATNPNLFEHLVAPSWDAGFQRYTFTFTAPYSANAKIYFQQILAVGRNGNAIDEITFADSNLNILLSDNFDSENPVYLPPACGKGTTPIPYVGGSVVYNALIPAMTGASTPSGTASASANSGGFLPWMAFAQAGYSEAGLPNKWQSVGSFSGDIPDWLAYQFGSPQVVTRYEFGGNNSFGASPVDWTFEGSNDGASWTVLHTMVGYHWPKPYTVPASDNFYVSSFNITNTTAYSRYRIRCTKSVGGLFEVFLYRIYQFQMYSSTLVTTYTYAFGYGGCYGDNCSQQAAVGPQFQDSNPLPDIESGVAPTKYTGNKSFCAQCLAGTVNIQADDSDIGNRTVIDAADGTVFNFDTPPTLNIICWTFAVSGSFVLSIYGSNDGTTWFKIFITTGHGYAATPTGDANIGFVSGSCSSFDPVQYKYFKLAYDKTKGTLSKYSFGGIKIADSPQVCKSATATSYISQSDADSKALAAATLAAQSALQCVQVYNSTQTYTATCPLGNGSSVTKTATATSFTSQAAADAEALADAKAQALAAIDCSQSNNTQPVTINDNAVATPYPSVKVVSGMTGHITKVTVAIKGFKHTYPNDVDILLVSPSGAMVNLMRLCGGQVLVTGVNLVFDDAASGSLNNTTLVSGTFKPTVLGPLISFPAPCPSGTPSTTLAAFIGGIPNGGWALYVQDVKQQDVGLIAQGWDLTITSA